MRSILALAVTLFLQQPVYGYQVYSLGFPYTPEAQTTGDLCNTSDPDFSEFRYSAHIPYCQRNVSRETKAMIYRQYGVPSRCRGEYTIDHFIPLSIGGTNDPSNLWPEHKELKATRSGLEMEVYQRLASGTISQSRAISIIRAAKWNPAKVDLRGRCQ